MLHKLLKKASKATFHWVNGWLDQTHRAAKHTRDLVSILLPRTECWQLHQPSPCLSTQALLNNLCLQTGVRYTLHAVSGYQKKKAVEIWPLDLYSSLFRQKQRSGLLISVLHKVWATVKNASYMGVGKVWVCRLHCCGRFFSQINESLDTWQVSVCKSLGRRSRHCSLFLSV